MPQNSKRHNYYVENIILSVILSFAAVSTIFLFKPLDIILSNPTDFISTIKELAGYYMSGIWMPLIALSTLSFLILSNNKFKPTYVALIFSISLLFFIQGNFLNWDYGLLDGRSIYWNGFWYRELIDLIIWASILGILFIKKHSLLKNVIIYSLALILIQAAPLGLGLYNKINVDNEKILVASNNPSHSSITYAIDYSQQYVFSKNKNIIILVLDAVSDYAVADIFKENPELANEFDGFIRFDNLLGTGGYTRFSVPGYISGKPYLNQEPFIEYTANAFKSSGSILKRLRNKNWSTGFYKNIILRSDSISPEILTEITLDPVKKKVSADPDLKKLSLYLSSPQSLKRWLYDLFRIAFIWEGNSQDILAETSENSKSFNLDPFPNNSTDFKFINNMLHTASANNDNPSFKYFHINGAHSPHVIDRKFRIRKEASYHDAVYVSLKIAVRFIHILKKLGIYDSSQIYIMADHGAFLTSSDMEATKQLMKSQFPKAATPMFMFKDFSAKNELEVSNVPLSHFDLPSIVTGMADKNVAQDPKDYIKQLSNKTRRFFSFSNTVGDYYPKIIELQVGQDSSDPNAWSLTGREYYPATTSPAKQFDCSNDKLSLTKRDEFIRYVPDNLLDISGLTRGGLVNITLPLKINCLSSDFIIKLRVAAVLGTNKKSGEKVNSRTFHIQLYDKYASTAQKISSEEYTDIYMSIQKQYLQGDSLQLTLIIDDWTPGLEFFDTQGERVVRAGLKLHSLSLSSKNIGDKYIELKLIN